MENGNATVAPLDFRFPIFDYRIERKMGKAEVV
jgi:hypothetical protein